jgi:hypothetical protein
MTRGKLVLFAIAWTVVVIPLSGNTANGQQRQIFNRFSSWTLGRDGDRIVLSSESGNVGVGCTDGTLTYVTLVKITDQSAVVWNPVPKAFYFNFTAWADEGPPSDFSFWVPDKSYDMASGIVVLNPDFTDQHTRFLGAAQGRKGQVLVQHSVRHRFRERH